MCFIECLLNYYQAKLRKKSKVIIKHLKNLSKERRKRMSPRKTNDINSKIHADID